MDVWSERAALRRASYAVAAVLVALLAAWLMLAGEAMAQEEAPENPNEKWKEDGTMGEPIGPGDPAPAPPGPIGPPTVGDTASGPTDSRMSLMSHAPVAPGAVVSNGTVALGVHSLAHLNYSGTGVRHEPNRADALIPGCPCEGWGIANAKVPSDKGYANVAAGTRGLVAESFEVDAAAGTAVSKVRAGSSFEVTHAYRPSSETKNLYAVTVTVKNTSGAAADARYRRVMDWDVPPNVFNEYVTNEDGDSPAVVYMSDNGFASADPMAGKSRMYREGDMKDAGPGDIGALFDFALGEIAPGAEKSFVIYYGAGPDEATMLGALEKVGAKTYSLGEPRVDPATGKPNTFAFGFKALADAPPAGNPEARNYVAIGDSTTTGHGVRDCPLEEEDKSRPYGCPVEPVRLPDPSDSRKLVAAAEPVAYPDQLAATLGAPYSDGYTVAEAGDYSASSEIGPPNGHFNRVGVFGYTIREAVDNYEQETDRRDGTPWESQLHAVDDAQKLVTVSIGNNDLQFSSTFFWLQQATMRNTEQKAKELIGELTQPRADGTSYMDEFFWDLEEGRRARG